MSAPSPLARPPSAADSTVAAAAASLIYYAANFVRIYQTELRAPFIVQHN